MNLPDKQTIQRLSLRQFTTFEQAAFDFCPGINVIIGTNSTGKTLMMKLMYALLKISQSVGERRVLTNGDFSEIIGAKLQKIFQLHWLSDLIRSERRDDNKKKLMEVELTYADIPLKLRIERSFDEDGQAIAHLAQTFQFPGSFISKPAPVYLPSQEMLSINQGFISLYQNKELPYDETYYDLSIALNALPLRSEKLGELQPVLNFLETIIAGENRSKEPILTIENNRFYFSLPEGRFETHFVAEGYRKIATLLYLLRNSSLTNNSILFWDEPEANLNPKLIVQVVEVLKMLAALGMQIFITTHDYLLAHELSLLTEYPQKNDTEMKFFALYRGNRAAGVHVESGHALANIEHNAILEEFAAHYDRETTLFHQHHNGEAQSA